MNRTDILKGYLPYDLRETEPLKSIFEAEGVETGELFNKVEETLNQLYVHTATDGLLLWEEFLGIPVDKENKNRRSVIISKLRGMGTVTRDFLQNVAHSFKNGDIEIREYPKEGYINIKFTSEVGLPPNFKDFKSMIENVKPAHLEVIYEFSYNTYNILRPFTHEYLGTKTHEELRSTNLT